MGAPWRTATTAGCREVRGADRYEPYAARSAAVAAAADGRSAVHGGAVRGRVWPGRAGPSRPAGGATLQHGGGGPEAWLSLP